MHKCMLPPPPRGPLQAKVEVGVNQAGIRGVFATERIRQGELIWDIPDASVLNTSPGSADVAVSGVACRGVAWHGVATAGANLSRALVLGEGFVWEQSWQLTSLNRTRGGGGGEGECHVRASGRVERASTCQ